MDFNENIAHIVYASDDRFAEIMGVSVVSLFENSKDMNDIIVYILDSGISESNRQKIYSVCQYYHRHAPIWIQAKDISSVLGIDVAVDRGSLSQYARLFVSSVLPKDLSRVLYLDCDIIIDKSIRELWNLDLQGKTIAALMDAFSKHYRANIGLKPNDIMFNSGVMLIDLLLWKDQKVEEHLLQFIADRKGKIQQGDQGALNAILSNDTFCFEPRFNSVTIFFDFTYKEMMVYRKPPKFYSEEEVNVAIEEPTIIHFTTSFLSRRPWIEGCKHKYIEKWLKYKEASPWSDNPLWQYSNPQGLRELYVSIMSLCPRKLMVSISGFLQAYGRPTINRIKNR